MRLLRLEVALLLSGVGTYDYCRLGSRGSWVGERLWLVVGETYVNLILI